MLNHGEEGEPKKNQKSKKMEGGEDEEVQERGEPCTGKSALINHLIFGTVCVIVQGTRVTVSTQASTQVCILRQSYRS